MPESGNGADEGQVVGRGRPHPGPLEARLLHDPVAQEHRSRAQHAIEQAPVHGEIPAPELEDARDAHDVFERAAGHVRLGQLHGVPGLRSPPAGRDAVTLPGFEGYAHPQVPQKLRRPHAGGYDDPVGRELLARGGYQPPTFAGWFESVDFRVLEYNHVPGGQVACETRGQGFGAHVEVILRVQRPYDGVAERGFQLEKCLFSEMPYLACVACGLCGLQQLGVLLECLLGESGDQESALVHLELDARGVQVFVELDGLLIQAHQRLQARLVTLPRRDPPEAPAPAQEIRIEPGAEAERAVGLEEHLQRLRRDAGGGHGDRDGRDHPASVPERGGSTTEITLDDGDVRAGVRQLVSATQPYHAATHDYDPQTSSSMETVRILDRLLLYHLVHVELEAQVPHPEGYEDDHNGHAVQQQGIDAHFVSPPFRDRDRDGSSLSACDLVDHRERHHIYHQTRHQAGDAEGLVQDPGPHRRHAASGDDGAERRCLAAETPHDREYQRDDDRGRPQRVGVEQSVHDRGNADREQDRRASYPQAQAPLQPHFARRGDVRVDERLIDVLDKDDGDRVEIRARRRHDDRQQRGHDEPDQPDRHHVLDKRRHPLVGRDVR